MQPAREEACGTKRSLERAAERLFARKGIARASVRAITQAAGANLASVHYHFGSKEGLVRSVFARRLAPLNQERLRLLERYEAEARGAPSPERIVHAFVSPALRIIQQEPGGLDFARLMMRSFSEPGEKVQTILVGQFRKVIERFTVALGKALPHLPREEVFWRFHFMIGSMVFAAGLGHVVQQYSGGLCDHQDIKNVTRRLVDFLAAGMERPAARRRGRS